MRKTEPKQNKRAWWQGPGQVWRTCTQVFLNLELDLPASELPHLITGGQSSENVGGEGVDICGTALEKSSWGWNIGYIPAGVACH